MCMYNLMNCNAELVVAYASECLRAFTKQCNLTPCNSLISYHCHLGKGTQSALLQDQYPCVHLSVGELLRQEQTKKDSANAALIQDLLIKGQIVPVEISIRLLEQAMQEAASTLGPNVIFLVDGFPRNLDNLQGWSLYARDHSMVWSVLVYHCPLDVLEARIMERAKTSGRSDDNIASLTRRFTTFQTETEPIVEILRETSERTHPRSFSVVDIHGDESLEQVWLKSQHSLNQLILHDVLTANARLFQAIDEGDAETYAKLCCNVMRGEQDAAGFMQNMEGDGSSERLQVGPISNAQLDVISGKQVAVSYDRTIQGQVVREKRIWSYKGMTGWCNVHFSRVPKAAVSLGEPTLA
jgi:UMP-CMP kinase